MMEESIDVTDDCLFCFDRNYEKYDFCMDLPLGLKIKPILKHKV